MNAKTKIGFDILKVALGLGILGDVLLRQTPWGLNALLFNLAFVAGLAVLLVLRKREYLTRQTIALLAAQVFFASMFIWRDAIELRVADTFAILAILSVLIVPRLKIPASVAGVIHYVVGFVWSALNAWFGSVALLAIDIDWKTGDRSAFARHAIGVLRGILIATPILLVFGALFMAADAAFEGMVDRVFSIAPEEVFTHGILIALFAWLSAGYLRGLVMGMEPAAVPVSPGEPAESSASKVEQVRSEEGERPVTLPGNLSVLEHINISDPPSDPSGTKESETNKNQWNWSKIENSLLPNAFTLGTVEVGVILGAIDLLFLSFVAFQLPYLFGGMELVQNTADFKLAEYARRGFAELVIVAALVLPVLLISHWLLRKGSPLTEKLYRVLAGIQIVLLLVIMASAVQRLVLLTGNLGYGLTTVRLYPMVLMVWLAVVFAWFCLTVLRGARQYFAWGALWSAFFVLAATHVLNPDGFIVRTNVNLMKQGREFDGQYNSRLSDDAIPALIGSFTDLDEKSQQFVIKNLTRRNCQKANEGDLRSWNLSRQTASQELAPYREILDGLGCPPPNLLPAED